MNIVGDLYPLLDKEERVIALQNVLGHLDGLRDDYATNHVERIHEPWLVCDVIINCWNYWPGASEYVSFLKKDPSWSEVFELTNSAQGKCWLTLAVVNTVKENTTLDTRRHFYRTFPILVDCTLDFIAARIVVCADDLQKKQKKQNRNILQSIL